MDKDDKVYGCLKVGDLFYYDHMSNKYLFVVLKKYGTGERVRYWIYELRSNHIFKDDPASAKRIVL